MQPGSGSRRCLNRVGAAARCRQCPWATKRLPPSTGHPCAAQAHPAAAGVWGWTFPSPDAFKSRQVFFFKNKTRASAGDAASQRRGSPRCRILPGGHPSSSTRANRAFSVAFAFWSSWPKNPARSMWFRDTPVTGARWSPAAAQHCDPEAITAPIWPAAGLNVKTRGQASKKGSGFQKRAAALFTFINKEKTAPLHPPSPAQLHCGILPLLCPAGAVRPATGPASALPAPNRAGTTGTRSAPPGRVTPAACPLPTPRQLRWQRAAGGEGHRTCPIRGARRRLCFSSGRWKLRAEVFCLLSAVRPMHRPARQERGG